MRDGAIVVIIIIGILLAGCISSKGSSVETTATITEMPQSAIIDGISFTVIKYEFSNSYVCNCTWICEGTKTNVSPPEGAKFLGVYVRGKNVGEVAYDLPSPSQVDLIYKGTTISHTSPCKIFYTVLGRDEYDDGKIYPGVSHEGWIFYEVPIGFDETQAEINTMGHYWGLSLLKDHIIAPRNSS